MVTKAKPVPGEALGGDSAAPDRFTEKVIGEAAAGAASADTHTRLKTIRFNMGTSSLGSKTRQGLRETTRGARVVSIVTSAGDERLSTVRLAFWYPGKILDFAKCSAEGCNRDTSRA